MDCQICCEQKQQLYSISNCPHKFCLACCIGHIQEKSSRFIEVICPYPDCKKPFDKNDKVMSSLPVEVLTKLQKHQEFMYLQKNPNLRPCSLPNCNGTVDTKQSKRVCIRCGLAHCPKCMNGFHEGGCILNEHDKFMKAMNNQKCPNCSIWIEKKQGCDYIDCKCGTAFCYKCGIKFSEDPCRKGQLWKKEILVRKAINNFKLIMPENHGLKFVKILLLPLRAVLLIVLTAILSILVMFGGTVIVTACIVIGSPFLVIAILCSMQKEACFLQIVLVILFPLLVILSILIFLIAFLLFPLLRNFYHHGIYDGLEEIMNNIALAYLKMGAAIMDFNE